MMTLVILAAALVPIALQAQSQECVQENATLNGS